MKLIKVFMAVGVVFSVVYSIQRRQKLILKKYDSKELDNVICVTNLLYSGAQPKTEKAFIEL